MSGNVYVRERFNKNTGIQIQMSQYLKDGILEVSLPVCYWLEPSELSFYCGCKRRVAVRV